MKKISENIKKQLDFCKQHSILPAGMMPDPVFAARLNAYFRKEKAACGVTYPARMMLEDNWYEGEITFSRNGDRPVVCLKH